MEREEMRIFLNDYFKDKNIKVMVIEDAYWGRNLGFELNGNFDHEGFYGLNLDLKLRFIADDIDVVISISYISDVAKVLRLLNDYNRNNKVITAYVARNRMVFFKAHFNNVTKDNMAKYLDEFYKESYYTSNIVDDLSDYFCLD